MNKTDPQLKQDIEAEVLWDPRVNAAQIGVSVDEGTVSLLGSVVANPSTTLRTPRGRRRESPKSSIT